jgi:glycosyltransferase involved in cell wall biosynthesis
LYRAAEPTLPRVVSLTPTALSRDSRALKAAASYARFGFVSMVIEGAASERSFEELGIRLKAIAPSRPVAQRGRLAESRRGLIAALIFPAFMAYFVYTYLLRPLRVMRRGELYHLHSYEYFPLVRLWCALFGGSYLYDAHDFYLGIRGAAESSWQRRWIRRFQRWLEAKCIADAAACITVNQGTAAMIDAEFGRRPLVLRNCHDARLDRQPRETVREKAKVSRDEFLVVSIGQWKPGQATMEAIDALTMLDTRVHLAFVGAGHEWARPWIEKKQLVDRVHLVGPVSANEIVLFVNSADAALIHYREHNPNYANALPNGFFQSIAASLPLVYVDLPGIAAEARAHHLGIAVEGSAPAIAAALLRLVEDTGERQRQRDASQRFAAAVNFEKEEASLHALVVPLLLSKPERSCAA